jgi:anti-anti-sigma regulatory factor
MKIDVTLEEQDIVVDMRGVFTFYRHKEEDALLLRINTLMYEVGKRVRYKIADTYTLDSHWLGILIRVLRRTKSRHIDFIIEQPSGDIKLLLESVQIDRLIEIRS